MLRAEKSRTLTLVRGKTPLSKAVRHHSLASLDSSYVLVAFEDVRNQRLEVSGHVLSSDHERALEAQKIPNQHVTTFRIPDAIVVEKSVDNLDQEVVAKSTVHIEAKENRTKSREILVKTVRDQLAVDSETTADETAIL